MQQRIPFSKKQAASNVQTSQSDRCLTLLMFAIIATTLMTSTGCLRRRLTVRTSPPGAMLYVDRQPIGMTPVSTRFTYYGTRHFEIIKDGYRTEKFLRRFNPPWYELPGLAFVTETLWPFEKRDERLVDVQLSPEPVVPTEAVIASGQELRDQARMGLAVSAPASSTPIISDPSAMVLPTFPVPSPTDILPVNPNVLAPQPPTSRAFEFPVRIPASEPLPSGSYRPENSLVLP
jgi:hypothetical protein